MWHFRRDFPPNWGAKRHLRDADAFLLIFDIPQTLTQHGWGIILVDYRSPSRAAARLREQNEAKTCPQTCWPNPLLKREVGNQVFCNSQIVSRVRSGVGQTPAGDRTSTWERLDEVYRSSMGFLPSVPVEVVVAAFAYFRMTCQVDWFETSASREMVPFGRL